ncbi:MAG: lytic transglycosylase domain-containing protein [Pyrinomonadaceae bacterium]
MHQTRRFPRFRSFKFFSFALFALFAFTNLTDTPFTRAIAPTVEAKTVVDENFIPADVPTSGDTELDSIIYHAGLDTGVDPRLLHAVIWQESKYKVNALSNKNAQGLMQMIPATAKRFNCQNTSDPKENIAAGARYLRWLLERFDGDVSLALAGYNAGEGSVDKYAGVPPYTETQNYVRIITGRYGKFFHPLLTPEAARVEFHLLPELAQK